MSVRGPARIFVIDDSASHRVHVHRLLSERGHTVIAFESGPPAIESAQNRTPDLVLLDINMPELDGYEVCRWMKRLPGMDSVSILFCSTLIGTEQKVRAFEAGGADYITKPFEPEELNARVETHLALRFSRLELEAQRASLADEVRRRTAELRSVVTRLKAASLETAIRLSRAAEYRDDDTGAHVLRMSHYAAAIARRMGQSRDESAMLLHAATMHDVGKIGVPDAILLKPGKLTQKEWAVMRTHCAIGAGILADSEFEVIQLGETVAMTHHERWDGGGYPRGLAGTDIPLAGRICAVADVFDALTTRRPYKQPMPAPKAFEIIQDERGTHFDPEVVDAFFGVQSTILSLRAQYQDEFVENLRTMSQPDGSPG